MCVRVRVRVRVCACACACACACVWLECVRRVGIGIRVILNSIFLIFGVQLDIKRGAHLCYSSFPN